MIVSAKHSFEFCKMNSLNVPFGGLNIVNARGRWYVFTRKRPTITFVRGFEGTKDQLIGHLESPEIARRIVRSECGNRKGVATHHDAFREAIAKRIAASVVKRAAARCIQCDIDSQWIVSQLLTGADRCSLTGLPFDYRPRSKKDGWHKNPFAPSPDRIDRAKGYTPSNVRMILSSLNIAINEWGLDHFKELAVFVAARAR